MRPLGQVNAHSPRAQHDQRIRAPDTSANRRPLSAQVRRRANRLRPLRLQTPRRPAHGCRPNGAGRRDATPPDAPRNRAEPRAATSPTPTTHRSTPTLRYPNRGQRERRNPARCATPACRSPPVCREATAAKLRTPNTRCASNDTSTAAGARTTSGWHASEADHTMALRCRGHPRAPNAALPLNAVSGSDAHAAGPRTTQRPFGRDDPRRQTRQSVRRRRATPPARCATRHAHSSRPREARDCSPKHSHSSIHISAANPVYTNQPLCQL